MKQGSCGATVRNDRFGTYIQESIHRIFLSFERVYAGAGEKGRGRERG